MRNLLIVPLALASHFGHARCDRIRKPQIIKHVSLAAMSFLVFAAFASGRPMEGWPYEKLLEESDLVVIATAVSVEEVQVPVQDQPQAFRGDIAPQVTNFSVRAVIKGQLAGADLSVLHYRPDPGAAFLNGPSLVSFRHEVILLDGKNTKVRREPPEYLLFLKKGTHDRYEPVSGQIDPVFSVRQLHDSLPYWVPQRSQKPPAAYSMETRTKAIQNAYDAAAKIVQIPHDATLEVVEDQKQIVVTWKLRNDPPVPRGDYAAKVTVDRATGAVRQILVGP